MKNIFLSFIPLVLISFGIIQHLDLNSQTTQDIQNTWLDIQGVTFTSVTDLEISNSKKYKNLSLYLITGDAKPSLNYDFYTLNEALKYKSALVVETGNVNQLIVKNTSQQKDLFINSGDIVKGGKQDRTLVYDLWIPKNTETTLESFCVEAGRWQQRDNESVANFSTNSYGLSSRKLKIASSVKNSQSDVWDKVSEQQKEISYNLSFDVKSEKSESSLQLTLENSKLKKEISEFEKVFSAFGTEKDAIGFAYAINGELFGINYYSNPALFGKLRKKLLTAVFVEALGEKESKIYKREPSSSDLERVMTEFINADETQYKINNTHNLSLKWSLNSGYLIESRIQKDKSKSIGVSNFSAKDWVHRSYLFKPE